MIHYEQHLKNKNLCINTRSFYTHNLRMAYNHAVEDGKCEQQNPFKRVYTGIAKTRKIALSFNDMRRIKNLNLTGLPSWSLPAMPSFSVSSCEASPSLTSPFFARKIYDTVSSRTTAARPTSASA